MSDLAILFLHVIVTILRLLRPGGARSIIAESLLVKQQLLIINRSRQRGPNLRTMDRNYRWAVYSADAPKPGSPFRHHFEAFNDPQFSPVTGETQISASVLPDPPRKTWTEGSVERTD